MGESEGVSVTKLHNINILSKYHLQCQIITRTHYNKYPNIINTVFVRNDYLHCRVSIFQDMYLPVVVVEGSPDA